MKLSPFILVIKTNENRNVTGSLSQLTWPGENPLAIGGRNGSGKSIRKHMPALIAGPIMGSASIKKAIFSLLEAEAGSMPGLPAVNAYLNVGSFECLKMRRSKAASMTWPHDELFRQVLDHKIIKLI